MFEQGIVPRTLAREATRVGSKPLSLRFAAGALQSAPGDEMNPSSIDANESALQRSSGPLRLVRLQSYGLAIVSVSIALGAALLLDHFRIHQTEIPLLLFAGAISSWYGGPGPALLAVILSVLGFDYLYVPPLHTLYIGAPDVPYFIIFASFASLVSWFSTIRRRVEQDLRQIRDKLQIELEERKRWEEEIQALNKELARRSTALEASNKELEAFAYSISHDLRAPLRHMSGFAELLRKSAGASLNQKSAGYLTTILEAARRMGSLIDDLLAFSRISRAEAHKSMVSLEQLVQEAVAEISQDAKGRKIVWKISPLPEWYGDRTMLRLVLVNLVSNAVKFTRTRPQAEIEIGCTERKDDHAVLFVRDNGVGFDMRYSDKLFGVFQRLHAQEAFEGTGIGLATVQRIVQRHGGRAWAEGIVNGGATFYFSLSKITGS
jgi:signal transduction histidine kinase